MLMDQHNPFMAVLDASNAKCEQRRARLLPRLDHLTVGLGEADYRTPGQRHRVTRILLIAVLLATAEIGDPDFASLVSALQRGQDASGDGCERGHAAHDFVRTLVTAARLPHGDALLRRLAQSVFMSADDRSRLEWARVLSEAGRFVDALETAQPSHALSAMTSLLRTAVGRPA